MSKKLSNVCVGHHFTGRTEEEILEKIKEIQSNNFHKDVPMSFHASGYVSALKWVLRRSEKK